MRLHLEAMYSLDPQGHLRTTNEAAPRPAPRFFLGRTFDGNVWAVRHDVPSNLAAELDRLAGLEPPGAHSAASADHFLPFQELLESDTPIEKQWSGPNYAFPKDIRPSAEASAVGPSNESLLNAYLPEWLEDVAPEVPMAVALQDGQAVAVCCSVRISKSAHEAGVETHPDFRRRGHAAAAAALWANLVRKAGCVPLYSTSWENVASRALASRLGLLQYGSVDHAT